VRLDLLPPPTEEMLRFLRVHEVIRDYPELLPFLLSLGIDARESGGRVMGEVFTTGGPPLGALLAELAWRVDPGGPGLLRGGPSANRVG